MDHSGHVSMKNAAKCDSWREMQKSLNVKISNSNGTESLCSQYVRLNAGKLLKPNGSSSFRKLFEFCYGLSVGTCIDGRLNSFVFLTSS